jgi:RNA polymerase sigma-70 factor (ECF subfamily)
MSAGESDQELVARAVAGDRSALEELLLSQSPRLERHIAPKIPASLQGILSVEDVLQETFVQAFCTIGSFEFRSAQALSGWLTTIAENQLLDSVKAQQREKRGGERRQVRGPVDGQTSSILDLIEMLSDGGHTPGRSVARREAIQAIQVGIAGLPEDQREAIRMHLLEGKSLADTATAMHRSSGAVRALIQRGKEQLRAAMGRASLWLSTE